MPQQASSPLVHIHVHVKTEQNFVLYITDSLHKRETICLSSIKYYFGRMAKLFLAKHAFH